MLWVKFQSMMIRISLFLKIPNFKMLKILKDNSFNAGLEFSYRCSECKNVMPLFFYHCPVCYEFNTCKIIYEVKNNETH